MTLLTSESGNGLPCVALYLNEQYIDLFAHWNTICALRLALAHAVLELQIARTPGPGEYTLRPQTPHNLSEPMASVLQNAPLTELLPPALANEHDHAQAWQKQLGWLEEQGWQCIVVPLLRDVTLERLWPCAIRLLATRQGGNEIV